MCMSQKGQCYITATCLTKLNILHINNLKIKAIIELSLSGKSKVFLDFCISGSSFLCFIFAKFLEYFYNRILKILYSQKDWISYLLENTFQLFSLSVSKFVYKQLESLPLPNNFIQIKYWHSCCIHFHFKLRAKTQIFGTSKKNLKNKTKIQQFGCNVFSIFYRWAIGCIRFCRSLIKWIFTEIVS